MLALVERLEELFVLLYDEIFGEFFLSKERMVRLKKKKKEIISQTKCSMRLENFVFIISVRNAQVIFLAIKITGESRLYFRVRSSRRKDSLVSE